MRATAIAHPNIALVKYWGKRDLRENVPATGSVSMTLAGLETETTVEFGEAIEYDSLQLDGRAIRSGDVLDRVQNFLDLVRDRAGLELRARVESRNTFPTASGLASSASGFAALARAAVSAAGLDMTDEELSALARRGSGSAARSIFGGFVEMRSGSGGKSASAVQIADDNHWDLRCLVAETTTAEKAVGSTEGMLHTERTSPYYEAWLDVVKEDVEAARVAIEEREFETLAEIAETNCMRMHASAMAADPPLVYWNPTTLRVIEAIREARRGGLEAFFTIDAGPHVKVFCRPDAEAEVVDLIDSVEGVDELHETRPGPGARLVETSEVAP